MRERGNIKSGNVNSPMLNHARAQADEAAPQTALAIPASHPGEASRKPGAESAGRVSATSGRDDFSRQGIDRHCVFFPKVNHGADRLARFQQIESRVDPIVGHMVSDVRVDIEIAA